MGLDLQSLSITSVFNSIVNYFNSQENRTRWKELTSSSEGGFLIRLLSNVFSAISYRVVGQSRENFLSSATLTSSGIGIAQALGYSPYRGSNVKRTITIVPDGNYVIKKLDKVGVYSSEYDIISLDHVELQEGKEVEISTALGKVNEVSFTADTSKVKVFSLYTTGISEDFILEKDGEVMDTTSVVKEMLDDKYLVRTNPYNSIDILYLNSQESFKYKYSVGTEFVVKYIELADIESTAYSDDMIEYGTLKNVTLTDSYIAAETIDEIKVNAPLQHELQNLIRSKADYAKKLKVSVPSVIDTNFKALTPTYTQVSYLKDDLSMLTETEKDNYTSILKEENFFGTPIPDIVVPRREVASLDIELSLKNKYTNTSDIDLDISNILANSYDYALGLTFDTYSLERNLEDLSYVNYARVSHKINSRQTNANYQVGYILNQDENYYMVSKILGETDTTQPNWLQGELKDRTSEIDLGIEVTDGSIIWRAYKMLPNMPSDNLDIWRGSFQYGIGDFIYTTSLPNYMFKCVDLVKSSGSTMPDISSMSEGGFVTDGAIVWVTKPYTDADQWQSYTNYRLGSTVNVSSSSLYSLECVSYTGSTGADSDIDFELPVYSIIQALSTSNSFSIAGNKAFYVRSGDTISVASSSGYTTFSVANVEFISSTISEGVNYGATTKITVNQTISTPSTYTQIIAESRGTRDGQILWELVDDIDNITYNWNAYVTFDYDLSIKS